MGKESYSFAWRKAVVKDPSLSSITKLVLHTLHYYMDNNTGECFPSRETIAEDASLNVRTITPHLTKAQKAGYLIKIKKDFYEKTIIIFWPFWHLWPSLQNSLKLEWNLLLMKTASLTFYNLSFN
jgi:hypothetical protein